MELFKPEKIIIYTDNSSDIKAQEGLNINLKGSLLVVFLCTLAVMTIFEVVKQILNPSITIWQSHIITILFTSCLSIIIAYFAFQSLHDAHRRLSEELKKRIAAENLLRKSEAEYRTFVESADESIYTVDLQGKYLLTNTRNLERQGISSDKIQKKSYGDLHSREDTLHFSALIEKVITSRTSLQDEYERQGRSFIRQLNPVIDPESSEIIAITVISSEITERNCTEKALRQANKKLNLLSSITRHDINNQLTVLMGFLSVLEKEEPDPIHNEYFLRVMTSAKRISDMIQFTKEYEEIGVHAPIWEDVHSLVDLAGKNVHLGKVEVRNDLPSGMKIFADPLIVKVFYNLIDNAVRYGVKITVIRFSIQKSGLNHIILCEDDGEGVPIVEKDRIFDRGFGKNTGFGLALAREILDITDITIIENGEPQKGARFEITVPQGMLR